MQTCSRHRSGSSSVALVLTLLAAVTGCNTKRAPREARSRAVQLKGCKTRVSFSTVVHLRLRVDTAVTLEPQGKGLQVSVVHTLSPRDGGTHVFRDTSHRNSVSALPDSDDSEALSGTGRFSAVLSQTSKLISRPGAPVRIESIHSGDPTKPGLLRGQSLRMTTSVDWKPAPSMGSRTLELPTIHVDVGWKGCPVVRRSPR
jgi:hypothetical protein